MSRSFCCLLGLLALSPVACGPDRRPANPRDAAVEDSAAEEDGAPGPVDLAKGGGAADQAPAEEDMAKPGPRDLGLPACGGPLAVTPANSTMLVDSVHVFSQKFFASCKGVDVTPQVAFSVDPKFGGFVGNLFRSNAGVQGSTQIKATAGADSGTTTLTLKLTSVIVTPGTPADAPMKFGGNPDPNLAPEWVYPADGVMVPPNLSILEWQFNPKGNQLFEIAFTGGGVNFKVYTKCNAVGNGCGYLPDEPAWNLFSQALRDQTVTVTLRGTSGGAVGSAPPRRLLFSKEDITGGLYYWAASPGGVYRYDFGLRNQKAEAFYTQADAGGICAGCHALSRNGRRFAVGLNIPGTGMRVLDVANKGQVLWGAPGSNYEAFTPDGSKIITTEAGGLTLRDAANGNLIGPSPAVDKANMPDFSPDGSQVVFARPPGPLCFFGICNTLGVTDAGLFTVSFNGLGFGAPKQIVAGGNDLNNYYPSYSADGLAVVFNRSLRMGMDKGSYDAPDAKVWVVPAGGGNAAELAKLNDPVGSSWPKCAPFKHSFGGRPIFWVTYSTRRGYGLRGGKNAQIWMAAVDTAKANGGQDGSYPPFWLPFQDFGTGNHIPQWAEKVERKPCSVVQLQACAPSEVCQGGVCVPK